MYDGRFVGLIISHLAAMRVVMEFYGWSDHVQKWLDLFRLHASSFNEAEFLLAIGYEAELYRVQNGE